jgi:cytochrome c-type biogenesis protein CcmE
MAGTNEADQTRTQSNIISRSGNLKFYALGVVVLIVVAYLVYTNLQGATVYYLTPTELKAQTANGTANNSQVVRLAGTIVAGSTQRDSLGQNMTFLVTDGQETISVSYHGTAPDTFQEGNDVVAEGTYLAGGSFDAKTLLVKCPSKYEAKLDQASQGNK